MTKICGDINNDGIVDFADVQLLLQHVSNPELYPIDKWAGDVNGDGIVDMGDVTLLQNHIVDPETYPLHCKSTLTSNTTFYIALAVIVVAAILILLQKTRR